MFKNDHSFSDGMGMVSLLFVFSDNFTNDFFPQSMKKKSNLSGFWNSLLEFFKFMLFGWHTLYKIASLKATSKIFTKRPSGVTQIAKTLEFDLSTFKETAKKLNLTINELVLNLISCTLKKMDPESKNYTICIPIGNTKAPKSIKKTPVRNLMSGITFSMSLIDNIKEESFKVTGELKKLISTKLVTEFLTYFGIFLNELFPYRWYKYIACQIADKVDLTVSNMPGPTKPLTYQGMELMSMVPLVSTGPNKAFVCVFSYVDKIWITAEFDKIMGPCAEEFSKILKEKYETLI